MTLITYSNDPSLCAHTAGHKLWNWRDKSDLGWDVHQPNFTGKSGMILGYVLVIQNRNLMGIQTNPPQSCPPITGFRTWETKNSNGSKRAASPHAASCSWGKGGVWCDAKHLVPSNQQLGLMLMNIQPSTHENGYTHRYLLKQLDFQADHWERLSHKTSPYLLDIPISMLVKTSTCFLCSSANKLSHDMSPQDVPNAWIVRKSPQLSSFGSLAANYH